MREFPQGFPMGFPHLPMAGEAKYLGPIKKSNARIHSSVVQVAGAARAPRPGTVYLFSL